MLEPLGIVDDLQRKRLRYGRLYPRLKRFIDGLAPIFNPSKSTRIVVNCATGERTVERVAYVEPPKRVIPKPRKAPAFAREEYLLAKLRRNGLSAQDRKDERRLAAPIIEAVAQGFRLSADHLVGPCRTRRYAWARFGLFRILIENYDFSTAGVGRVTNRDHTSAMHGIARARELVKTDEDFRIRYEASLEILGLTKCSTGNEGVGQ